MNAYDLIGYAPAETRPELDAHTKNSIASRGSVGTLEDTVERTFLDPASFDTIRSGENAPFDVSGSLEAPASDAYGTVNSIDYWATYLAMPAHEAPRDGLEYAEYGDHGMIVHRLAGRSGGLFGFTYPGGAPSKRYKLNAGVEEMREQFKPEVAVFSEEIGELPQAAARDHARRSPQPRS